MAIVDGKRIRDLTFHKVKGRKEWWGVQRHERQWEVIGTVVETDTDEDPRTLRFHYCSPISQPVFLDSSWSSDTPLGEELTTSSWKKMPEGWRAAFRDALGLGVA